MAIQYDSVRDAIRAKLDEEVPRKFEGFAIDRGSVARVSYIASRETEVGTLYIFLHPIVSSNREAFTFEGAWNIAPEYPIGCLPSRLLTADGRVDAAIFQLSRARFRISRLKGMLKDFWWEVSQRPSLDDISEIASLSREEAESLEQATLQQRLPVIERAVRDALLDAHRLLMPFYDRLLVIKGRSSHT